MERITSLKEIVDKYDAFILDLWGVIHDGIALYPHAKETLYELYKKDKKIIFLSNAPRRSSVVIEGLTNFGVERKTYINAISSGEVTRDFFQQNVIGINYVYTGLEKDRKLLDGLGYEEVSDFAEADFILNTGLDHFGQPLAEKIPFLEKALEYQLPMICANPDMLVVRQTGERILCAGVLAEEYKKLGGQVKYIGKPYNEVYHKCLNILQKNHTETEMKILAVGDNLDTDIAGANTMGIDCLFLSGGILSTLEGKAPDDETVNQAIEKAGVKPIYTCQHFDW